MEDELAWITRRLSDRWGDHDRADEVIQAGRIAAWLVLRDYGGDPGAALTAAYLAAARDTRVSPEEWDELMDHAADETEREPRFLVFAHRHVVVLDRLLQGWDPMVIAADLGWSVGTVDTVVEEIRTRLR